MLIGRTISPNFSDQGEGMCYVLCSCIYTRIC